MKKIYLIDGNSFIYRMFFALPEFSTKDGTIVNALFGMAKFFVHSLVNEKPDYIVYVKDAKGENFRHKLYGEYKATRDKMPDNLKSQVCYIDEMIKKMDIDIVEINGFEADDVIGTLAVELGNNPENEVFILTGDKDLYSLTTKNVSIYDTMKKKIYNGEKTKEKFGIEPKLIIDYLAIVGDKADNIPGIEGFGPKKAVDLINNIGTVEEILKQVELVESGEKPSDDFDKSIQSCFKGKTFEKLVNSKQNAILSKKLATLELNVELDNFDIENYSFDGVSIINEEIKEFFKKYEFNSLLGETESKKLSSFDDLNLDVKIIDNDSDLEKLSKKISEYQEIILDTETTSLNYFEAELVGISIYLDEKNIFYINRLHNGEKVSDTSLKKFLNSILEDDSKTIVGHNLKYDLQILKLFLSGTDLSKPENKNDGQISLNI